MSENDPKPAKSKQPYVKPEVTRVPIRPEEAVLGFCKTATGAAGVGTPTDCATCASPGS